MMMITAVALCVLLGVVLVVAIQHRHRRAMDALMSRLSELEAKGPARESQTAVTAPDEAEPDSAAPGAPFDSVPPTADVLAGKTSYVRRMVEGSDGEAASLADQTIVSIHRHIEKNITPRQLADELYVSLRTLERGLAATLECTPSQLILAMKMREARRLLLSGSYRVNEVAYHLGFSSPSHFSKRFKSFYRKAPSELVKRVTEAA